MKIRLSKTASNGWTVASASALVLSAALAAACGGAAEEKKEEPKADAKPATSASASASAKAAPSASASAAAPKLTFEELVAKSKPVEAKPTEEALGTMTVKAELCVIEGGGALAKSRSSVIPSVALQGKRLFATDGDDKLRAYELATDGGCKLTPVASFGEKGVMKLEKKARTVSANKDFVIASDGVFGSSVLKDDKLFYQCEARPQGYVTIAPTGKWGVGHFANATVAKVTFEDTKCSSAAWVFEDLSKPERKGDLTNVNSIGFDGKTVLVGGIIAKEVNPKEPRVVIGLSDAGKELFRLGNLETSSADDGLGWVHAVSGCKAGICVLDGNYRKLAMWDKKGKFIAKVALDKLFGVKSPWMSSFAVGEDGALYIAAGVDREGDRSEGTVAEALVFRVTM